jgi:hypothetical protein
MDTKPSEIFSTKYQNSNTNYLMTWGQLTNKLDIFRNIKNILKREYNIQMATNAWIKMYEILNLFPDIIQKLSTDSEKNISLFKTFHLCEAPGAFISAIDHYLSDKRVDKWEWYAQTLKPTNDTNNTALDDHFGLIASHPKRWLFGDPTTDDSGDITHSAVIKYYAANVHLKKIDFMTADGGAPCQPNELNEQETVLSKINMGQIICIFACLSVGKSAMFKTFLPMSEPLTISMMYLVTHLFESVNIIKPKTSHSYNSEVYIMATGYKGIKPTMLELLYVLLDDPKITSKTLLFPQIESDKTFLKSYVNSVGSFIDRQIQSFSMYYYYYYHLDEVDKLQNMSNTVTNDWFRNNPVPIFNSKLIREEIF